MAAERHIPGIRFSDAARQVLRDALADGRSGLRRLRIDERFEHELLFGSGTERDIAVETDGISLWLDPASAHRADGLAIDYVQELRGAGFTFDNPNQPGHAQRIALKRDCTATLIPRGEPLRLARGEWVVVTQSLGGSFTIRTASGQLARIAAGEADALGLSMPQASAQPASGTLNVQQVLDVLRTVYDPEIPVNVVDLGLIYQCQLQPLEGGGQRVAIRMSMTAPGCGMGEVLKEEARAKVQVLPGVSQVDIELVWEPPWDQSRMSEAARLQLGLL
ncbi:putative Fe-S cluster assembly protein SufT [Pseudomonas sp. R5(2019)]|uniref:putative Fe-S cluster assembly protein SufT n=1 Tax=Pseudomonas sp. R5(2019) TaxID=2697566 RepID=UPI001411E051|nr:putative Fe-S cluster assembly protein SufT [Pseudomonas sp. R5(2019)]NBA93520.1 putative Fe-S cluster assembly protein SufT [Pseudomonas sp. R5(2019)]